MESTNSSVDLTTVYEPVAAELAQTELALADALRSPLDHVEQLTRHTARYGGKRLRPALLLLAARTCGRIDPSHIVLAAVVEMIHTATLVHDDVLDGASMRRHVATVHAEWGVAQSILLGDYLFSRAFQMAAETGRADACAAIGLATSAVCAGELQQTHHTGNLHLTEQQYLEIVEGKTASLCACSCRLGAELADGDARCVAALTDYGRLLGIGFQITDDLLDLVGQEPAVGKSLGVDIENYKPTLPLIRLLADADARTSARIERLWTSGEPAGLAELRDVIVSSGAVDTAFAEADRYVDQACRQLETLPPCPSRESLADLARFVTRRKF